MDRHARFIDALITSNMTPEQRDRAFGHNAVIYDRPRDESQSSAWLRGYDEAVELFRERGRDAFQRGEARDAGRCQAWIEGYDDAAAGAGSERDPG